MVVIDILFHKFVCVCDLPETTRWIIVSIIRPLSSLDSSHKKDNIFFAIRFYELGISRVAVISVFVNFPKNAN